MIRFEPMASRDMAGHLAASIQRRAPEATHTLVGPVLYQETWLGVLVRVGCPKTGGKFIGLEMSVWQSAAPGNPAISPGRLQTWIWQRERNPQQRPDAALRWAFVVELERSFPHVETYDNDIALGRAYLRLFGKQAPWPEAQGVKLHDR